MLLGAGRAAVEMRAHPGDGGVRILARELELDVAVEVREALVAAELRVGRAEQACEQVGYVVPLSVTAPRRVRRASCRVL